jgi:hypothetical protein
MSTKARQTADLVSGDNIFSNINSNQIGIGTTVTTSKLTVAGDINLTGGGIITATAGVVTYYGDGSNLINLPASGFEQDADGNLIAGGGAGGSYDPSTGTSCFNIFMGCNAGANIAGGWC